MCTSINTSVAQEKAKTRCLIKVILLDAKSGWRRRCQESFKIPDKPVMSEGELSGTFEIVRQIWLLCADVPEHVGNARPPHVQPAIILVRRLGALLAPLHRLNQFPNLTVYSI